MTIYKKALKRIKTWTGILSNALAFNPSGAGKRAGLVPIDYDEWNYGQIAQVLDKKNRFLGGRHLGPQSVMTQDSCANEGPAGFGERAKELRLQYRFKFIEKKVKRRGADGKPKKKKTITIRRKLKKKARPLLENLSLQISFSDTPDFSSSLPVTRTAPLTAALCAFAGLKQKGGAFFFFASPDAMRILFQQTPIAALRPPTT